MKLRKMNSQPSYMVLVVVSAVTLVSVADGYCIWYGHCGTNPLFPDSGPLGGPLLGGKPLNKYDDTKVSNY